MNVLMLHQYFNIEGAASETRFYQIGRRLASLGHSVTVITGNSPLALPLGKKKIGLLQKDGIAVIVFNIHYDSKMKLSEKRRAFIAYARQVLQQGRRLPRPDLIIASSPPLTAVYPALSLSRRYRAPLILEIRELWPEALIQRGTLNSKALISLARRLEQKAYLCAAGIIVSTAGVADAVKKRSVGTGPIHILPGELSGNEFVDQFSRVAKEFMHKL